MEKHFSSLLRKLQLPSNDDSERMKMLVEMVLFLNSKVELLENTILELKNQIDSHSNMNNISELYSESVDMDQNFVSVVSSGEPGTGDAPVSSDINFIDDENEETNQYEHNGNSTDDWDAKETTSFQDNEYEEVMMFDDELASSSNVFSENQSVKGEDYDSLLRELNEKESVHIPMFVFQKLMPHQKYGVYFLWKNMFKNENGVNGCILADFMGLGKTIQVTTLVNMYNSHFRDQCVLIVSPASVCQHWEREFSKIRNWIDEQDPNERKLCKTLCPLILGSYKTPEGRLRILEKWKREGQVLICTYDLYRQCAMCGDANFVEYLVNPGPNMIILDEGHKIKHMNSQISKILSKIATKRRIIMTGYPLQNNLMEYYTMINFAMPDLLGSPLEFRTMYEKPISKVQNKAKCTIIQKKQARRKAWMLHEKVKHIILRRDISLLKNNLPKKHEIIIKIRLTDVQNKFYEMLIQCIENVAPKNSILWAFDVITMLCNHPDVLYNYYKVKKKQYENRIASTENSSNQCSTKGNKLSLHQRRESELDDVQNTLVEQELDMYMNSPINIEDTSEQLSFEAQKAMIDILSSLFENPPIEYKKAVDNSGKMLVLFSIIFQARKLKDKVVVFSRSINTLNFIQASLVRFNKNKEKASHINFLRFDGSTSLIDRQQYIDQFNDINGGKDLLLVSTLAGGEGINLCAANRVVLMDVNWNPSHDCEACCRVFRFGQSKEVFIYRLITEDTIEDKVHYRQIKKELLSNWVVDDFSTDIFEMADVKSLLTLPKGSNEEEPQVDENVNDPLLSTIIQHYPKLITKVSLYDHLLIKDPTNILSEEDKKLARGEEEFDSIYGIPRLTRKQSNPSPKKTPKLNRTPKYVKDSNTITDKEYQAELRNFLLSEQADRYKEQSEKEKQPENDLIDLIEKESIEESSRITEEIIRNTKPDRSHLYSLIADEVKEKLLSSQLAATNSENHDNNNSSEHLLLEKEKSSMALRMARKAEQRKLQKKRNTILPTPELNGASNNLANNRNSGRSSSPYILHNNRNAIKENGRRDYNPFIFQHDHRTIAGEQDNYYHRQYSHHVQSNFYRNNCHAQLNESNNRSHSGQHKRVKENDRKNNHSNRASKKSKY